MLRAAVFSGLFILGITQAQSAEDLSNIIGLIRAAPENAWIKMNTNKFSDVWVPEELRPPYPSFVHPGTIIDAWSSFAWDSNRGDLLIFGGARKLLGQRGLPLARLHAKVGKGFAAFRARSYDPDPRRGRAAVIAHL
jgi:hypothetical protein